jgi:uncharacterized membrane protein/glutaredoxin
MESDNSTKVLSRLITELNIPVSRRSIKQDLQRHPDFGSMLAFTDVLTNWQVNSAAYHIPFENIDQVPSPFIAYLSKKEFALVTHIDEKQARLSNERWNNKAMPINEFKRLYGGSILVAEKTDDSGEPDYQLERRKEIIEGLRLPFSLSAVFVLLIGLLFFHSAYINSFNLTIALITIFKTAGFAVSVLLLMQSVDTNNPLIQKLCGGDNSSDCNAILSSKAAKINDQLSWSEVGFFYFAGTWLIFLFNSSNLSIMQILAWFNLLCLPYTFYSIYYQWRVVKQWCIFCCSIQALLWLEFFALLPFLKYPVLLPNVKDLFNIIAGLMTPVLCWILLKPYLLKAQQLAPLKQQLQRFKYNPDLFKKLINEAAQYALLPNEYSIIMGNPASENVITMVSNPFCQPCAKAHKQLDEWLHTRANVKLQVIFMTQNAAWDEASKVAAHLMAIQSENKDLLQNAVNDWYEQKQKNYEAWASRYPLNEIPDAQQILQKQRDWYQLADVKHTPTIFINGRELPEVYHIGDLQHLV